MVGGRDDSTFRSGIVSLVLKVIFWPDSLNFKRRPITLGFSRQQVKITVVLPFTFSGGRPVVLRPSK